MGHSHGHPLDSVLTDHLETVCYHAWWAAGPVGDQIMTCRALLIPALALLLEVTTFSGPHSSACPRSMLSSCLPRVYSYHRALGIMPLFYQKKKKKCQELLFSLVPLISMFPSVVSV